MSPNSPSFFFLTTLIILSFSHLTLSSLSPIPCSQHFTPTSCHLNNCIWTSPLTSPYPHIKTSTCIKPPPSYLKKHNPQTSPIILSLPLSQPFPYIQNTPLQNCTSHTSIPKTTSNTKCNWQITPFSLSHSVSINLTQNVNGDYIFGFHVKYSNGNKKSHLVYRDHKEAKRSMYYDIGSQIQDIVFELVSFGNITSEMFTAEITMHSNKYRFRNIKYKVMLIVKDNLMVVFVLLGCVILFLFFLIRLIRICIRNCKKKKVLYMQMNRRNIWKNEKKKEVNNYFAQEFKSAKINEIKSKYKGDWTCSICLEEFAEHKMDVIKLECEHLFHCKCIYDWMMEKYANPYCPICHKVIVHNSSGNGNSFLLDRSMIIQNLSMSMSYSLSNESMASGNGEYELGESMI